MTQKSEGEHSESKKGFANDIKTYIENRLQLFIIDLSEQVSTILADSIRRSIGILLVAFGFLFAWFALAFYLGGLLGSVSLGFLISSIPLIIAGLLFTKFESKFLVEKIQAEMVSKVLENFDSSATQEKTEDKTNTNNQ